MALVDNAGLFAPVDADTLAQVPRTIRPATGNWVGIAARTTVFAYNKTKLNGRQLPKSMHGSRRPELEGPLGRLAVGRRLPGDRQRACCQLKGEAATAAWLKAMKDNVVAYQRQQRGDEGGQRRRGRGRA